MQKVLDPLNDTESQAEECLRKAIGVTSTPKCDGQPSRLSEKCKEVVKLLHNLPILHKTKSYSWIPRGLERRYAAARFAPIDALLDEILKQYPDEDVAGYWNEIAMIMPHSLLREPPNKRRVKETRKCQLE